LAKKVERQALPVRALEREVQAINGASRRPRPRGVARPEGFDPETAALREFQQRLERHLGSPVVVKRQGKKGRIEIEFFSDDDLIRVLEQIGVDSRI
jgi:ParB family chromosome partitioning protein